MDILCMDRSMVYIGITLNNHDLHPLTLELNPSLRTT